MYGTAEKRCERVVGSQSSVKKWLVAVIAAIGVVSLLGAFAHLSENAATGSAGVVSRAMINAHQSKPDAVFCASYDKTVGITRNQQLAAVPYGQNLRVSFYTKITGGAFGNVLQLGAQDGDEWPGIFYNRGQPDHHLLFTFGKEGESKTEVEIVEIKHNTDLLVQVEINNLQAKISLDGKLVRQVTIPAELKPVTGSSLPVFAGSNFNNAAGGFIRDLEVCSSFASLPSPRPKCQREFGPFTLTRGQQIMTTDIFENYDVTFKVTIMPGSSNGDIFQIGKDAEEEGPRIHWQTNGYLYLFFDTTWGGQWAPNINAGVMAGSEVEVKVEVRQYSVRLVVDGVQKYHGTMGSASKLIGHQIGVFASSPPNNPASGSIREVEICNY